jgi:hypothetical protein
MTTVLLFHHAQGHTKGLLAFADELREAGHTVHAPDLYDGRTFKDLDEGVAYAREVGFEEVPSKRSSAEARPTVPLASAWTSPTISYGNPSVSSICLPQTRAAVSPSETHSSGALPMSSAPGCLEIRWSTASSSPSRTAWRNRVTTCRSSSDGFTSEVWRASRRRYRGESALEASASTEGNSVRSVGRS